MLRIQQLIGKWRDSGVMWWILAVALASSARDTIWPAYVWLRRRWIAIGWPPEYTWIASAIYFSFWIWLFVFFAREGKRHPGMILDAVCGGLLLAVATALHDPHVRAALSELGFGAATWVTLISAAILIVARSAQRPNM